MKFRVIAQINRVTKARIVIFTVDELSPTEDFLITSDSWKDAEVIEGHVGIIGDEQVLHALADAELKGEAVLDPVLDPEAVAAVKNMVRQPGSTIH